METARESGNVLAKRATGDGQLCLCSVAWNVLAYETLDSHNAREAALPKTCRLVYSSLVYTFKSELLVQTDSNEFPAYLRGILGVD